MPNLRPLENPKCTFCGWPFDPSVGCLTCKILKDRSKDNYEELTVSKPDHYQTGDLETIDVIKAKLTPEEFRGYCKGNALKYVSREAGKGGDMDLKKAVWYLRAAVGEDPRGNK